MRGFQRISTTCTVAIALSIAGCAMQAKQTEQSLKQPVNCDTSEGDIRALESEKKNAAEQAAAGVGSIVPAGLVSGILTGTAGTKKRIATGEYNAAIEKRIAEIKATCGL